MSANVSNLQLWVQYGKTCIDCRQHKQILWDWFVDMLVYINFNCSERVLVHQTRYRVCSCLLRTYYFWKQYNYPSLRSKDFVCEQLQITVCTLFYAGQKFHPSKSSNHHMSCIATLMSINANGIYRTINSIDIDSNFGASSGIKGLKNLLLQIIQQCTWWCLCILFRLCTTTECREPLMHALFHHGCLYTEKDVPTYKRLYNFQRLKCQEVDSTIRGGVFCHCQGSVQRQGSQEKLKHALFFYSRLASSRRVTACTVVDDPQR